MSDQCCRVCRLCPQSAASPSETGKVFQTAFLRCESGFGLQRRRFGEAGDGVPVFVTFFWCQPRAADAQDVGQCQVLSGAVARLMPPVGQKRTSAVTLQAEHGSPSARQGVEENDTVFRPVGLRPGGNTGNQGDAAVVAAWRGDSCSPGLMAKTAPVAFDGFELFGIGYRTEADDGVGHFFGNQADGVEADRGCAG